MTGQMPSVWKIFSTHREKHLSKAGGYRWKEHDSLTVRGNKWFRHSQSKGGYPIDFVMEFYGKSFPEAVQLLTGESGEDRPKPPQHRPQSSTCPYTTAQSTEQFNIFVKAEVSTNRLLRLFFFPGIFTRTANGTMLCLSGRDRSGTPRYAHVRGTQESFRQDIAGSDKSYPFRYEGNGSQLFVFEAPIDLLSFICLYPQDWQTRSYLALGGVSGKALDRFLSERKDILKVFLALTATPQEMKPVPDWHRLFPARTLSFVLSRQEKTGTMFSVSKGIFPTANS